MKVNAALERALIEVWQLEMVGVLPLDFLEVIFKFDVVCRVT